MNQKLKFWIWWFVKTCHVILGRRQRLNRQSFGPRLLSPPPNTLPLCTTTAPTPFFTDLTNNLHADTAPANPHSQQHSVRLFPIATTTTKMRKRIQGLERPLTNRWTSSWRSLTRRSLRGGSARPSKPPTIGTAFCSTTKRCSTFASRHLPLLASAITVQISACCGRRPVRRWIWLPPFTERDRKHCATKRRRPPFHLVVAYAACTSIWNTTY